MKRIRRVASLLLAMVMVFGMTATAWAAQTTDEVKVKVEIEKDESNPDGKPHTYTVYQILKGKLSPMEVDGVRKEYLVDIEWGDGIKPKHTEFLAALKSSEFAYASIFADAESAEDVAGKLDGKVYNDELAKAFANKANEYKTTGTAIEGDSVMLSPGYYLVVDSTGDLGDNDAYNSALLQVADSQGITIAKKYEVPKVDKWVKATEDEGEAGTAADVSIGDSVTFTLRGTLPSNYDDYETYKYEFTDTLSAGLEYQDDASVRLYADEDAFKADTDGTGGTPLTCTPVKGQLTLTWTFDNLKDLKDVGITENSVIVIIYTAKLTSNAEVGMEGNPNKVTLTYTNNPNYTGTGEPTTSTTPEDKVLVFTYEIDGTKVDSKDETKKLEGAEFILYRGLNGAAPGEDDGDGNPTNVEYALVKDGRLNGWTTDRAMAMAEENLLKSLGETGEFKLAGLDDGTYYLEEIKAPAGYNLLKDPIEIVVTATLDKTDSKLGLTGLTISVNGGEEKPGDIMKGTVSFNVKNSVGVLLPSTGGVGTTLFYIVGVALVLAAGTLLVVRKRTGEK